MSTIDSISNDGVSGPAAYPTTLPITVPQYRLLAESGTFDRHVGQVELIYGRIVWINPQGPQHADPIDELTEWSVESAKSKFRVRIEKPIEIVELHSSPEPDIAWVTLRRYGDRHPTPEDIHLLIEVSYSSQTFDRAEKLRLYAESNIVEYWIVDVPAQTVEVFSNPQGTEYRQSSLHQKTEAIAPACLPAAQLRIARLFSKTIG